MTMHFRSLAELAVADGTIAPDELLALRREGWGDGTIAPEEAEQIFAVNDRLTAPDAAWSDFFVEALSEFLVNGLEPKGYVPASQADWLVDRIDHNGRLDSMTELELLVRVLEKALNVPLGLKLYALSQIEVAVLTGEGPTRTGGRLERGNVTSAEVALIRRIVFAQASDRPGAVSQREAEMLFRIKDATLGASDNAPEWKRMFVQGVGNYLKAFIAYEPLSRERAAELEGFMNDSTPSLMGFAGRVARADVNSGVGDVFAALFGRKQAGADRAAQIAEADKVDHAENTWLQGQIDANGQIDEYDRALLNFLEED